VGKNKNLGPFPGFQGKSGLKERRKFIRYSQKIKGVLKRIFPSILNILGDMNVSL
jgi:hypothetical protein